MWLCGRVFGRLSSDHAHVRAITVEHHPVDERRLAELDPAWRGDLVEHIAGVAPEVVHAHVELEPADRSHSAGCGMGMGIGGWAMCH